MPTKTLAEPTAEDMTVESIRPRVKGETTFVDDLITFAVDTANQCLVPTGIAKTHWDGLSGAERFYLKGEAVGSSRNRKSGAYSLQYQRMSSVETM